MADDVYYHDMIYEQPFRGREQVRGGGGGEGEGTAMTDMICGHDPKHSGAGSRCGGGQVCGGGNAEHRWQGGGGGRKTGGGQGGEKGGQDEGRRWPRNGCLARVGECLERLRLKTKTKTKDED